MSLTVVDGEAAAISPDEIFLPGELRIPESFDLEDCRPIAAKLHELGTNYQWWWGDLLVYIERWGEEAWQIFPPEWREVAENRSDWHWTASMFPPPMRRLSNPVVSWTHHRVAAGLGTERERTEALDLVEEQGWSTRELSAHVKEIKNAGKSLPEGDDDDEEAPNRVGYDILISIPAGMLDQVKEIARQHCDAIEAELRGMGLEPGQYTATVRGR